MKRGEEGEKGGGGGPLSRVQSELGCGCRCPPGPVNGVGLRLVWPLRVVSTGPEALPHYRHHCLHSKWTALSLGLFLNSLVLLCPSTCPSGNHDGHCARAAALRCPCEASSPLSLLCML